MKKTVLSLLALLCALSLLASCGGSDLPPDNGTPAPSVLNGVYACDGGTLTFNGDGRSVVIDLTDELSAAAGLPAGKQTALYVFLFRNEEYRRDLAETVRFTYGDTTYSFRNAVSLTGEDTVALYLTGGGEPVTFRLQREG